MINEFDILQGRNSRDFSRYSVKQVLWLLCVISYHHELIIELGEKRFVSFSEPLISLNWRTPFLLIEPTWNSKENIQLFELVLLNFCTEIPLVSKHKTFVRFPLLILKIVDVMNVCNCHVITMDDAVYSAEIMNLFFIIIYALEVATPPGRGLFRCIPTHGTTWGFCILQDFDMFGLNAEHKIFPIYGRYNLLSDFFAKNISLIAPAVILTTTYKVLILSAAFILPTIKKGVSVIDAENFRHGGKSDDSQIRELGSNISAGTHSSAYLHGFGQILCICRMFSKFTLRLSICAIIVINYY